MPENTIFALVQTQNHSITIQNRELAERSWSPFNSHTGRSRFNLLIWSAGKEKSHPKLSSLPVCSGWNGCTCSDCSEITCISRKRTKLQTGVDRQVLSHTTTPPLQALSERAALWDWPGAVEGHVCPSQQFCLPLWAPQCHDGPKWPPQHK